MSVDLTNVGPAFKEGFPIWDALLRDLQDEDREKAIDVMAWNIMVILEKARLNGGLPDLERVSKEYLALHPEYT